MATPPPKTSRASGANTQKKKNPTQKLGWLQHLAPVDGKAWLCPWLPHLIKAVERAKRIERQMEQIVSKIQIIQCFIIVLVQ